MSSLKCLIVAFGLVIASLWLVSSQAIADQELDTTPDLLISELLVRSEQTTGEGTINEHERFIELYNFGEQPVDIAGWKLEYKPYQDGTWSSRLKSTQPEGSSYIIDPGDFLVIATDNFVLANPNIEVPLRLNNSALTSIYGGHIRLTTADGVIVDLVGWGDEADSSIGSPAVVPGNRQSLQRCMRSDTGLLAQTGNNRDDFKIYSETTPGASTTCPVEEPPENPPDDSEPVPEPEPEPEPPLPELPAACEGVVISEILPNPSGADKGKEFMELHNTTSETVNMAGCGLLLDGKTSSFVFGELEMAANEYRAFDDVYTSIVLPNTAGGKLFLLSPDQTEIYQAVYPGSLAEDVSWARFGDSGWQQTYAPTPGEANISQPDKPLEPCPAGQERNPNTNRCITDPIAPAFVACSAGQERNPITNRCRNIITAISSLVPCGAGQERNPATNRCRSISTTSTSTLVPCAPGQERNPETNRCRKTPSSSDQSGVAGVQDIPAVLETKKTGWWLAGFAGSAALSYGAWEWRRDLWGLLYKLRGKS